MGHKRRVLLFYFSSDSNTIHQIELLAWMSRPALELIGQCGFGYSFDGLKEDSDPHPFSESIKRFE